MEAEVVKSLLAVLGEHQWLLVTIAVIGVVSTVIQKVARAIESAGNAFHAWRRDRRVVAVPRRPQARSSHANRKEPHHPRDRGE